MPVDHREIAFEAVIERQQTTSGVYVGGDRQLCRELEAVFVYTAATSETEDREGSN